MPQVRIGTGRSATNRPDGSTRAEFDCSEFDCSEFARVQSRAAESGSRAVVGETGGRPADWSGSGGRESSGAEDKYQEAV